MLNSYKRLYILKIKREYKIGLLALTALILFIWGFNYLKGRDIFLKEQHYYAVYSQVSGLVEGSTVEISGLKVGRIERIFFHPSQPEMVVVRFAVRRDIAVPVNSVARIFSADLLGTRAIELNLGDAPQIAQRGDTLTSEIQVSISEEVSIQMVPFKKKAEDLMLSIDSVMAVIQYIFNEETRDNISQSFESIRQTIANLEQATYSLDTLVSEEKTRISSIFAHIESVSLNLRRSNDEITNILENFSSISDSLVKADLANVMRNADKAIADVSDVMEKINKGEGTLGLLINDDSLYHNLEKSSRELELLLEDLRLHPERYLHFSVFGRRSKSQQPAKAPKGE